jgi:hypothetical protein
MRLNNVRLIPLEDFEDESLLLAKKKRSPAEYCWTCTPSLVSYVMEQEPGIELIAYLDADLFFWSDPYPIYNELGSNSILIIEHRYSPEYEVWKESAGIYNVSMVIFRNDPYGRECLDWWKERCIEACYLDEEAGQCGDQKYLDDWPSRFKKVVVLKHKGGGLAPWNVSNYRIHKENGGIFVDTDRLIFYHFHQLQIVGRSFLSMHPFIATTHYEHTKHQLRLIYQPYILEIARMIREVEQVSPGFTWGYIYMSLSGMTKALFEGKLLLA